MRARAPQAARRRRASLTARPRACHSGSLASKRTRSGPAKRAPCVVCTKSMMRCASIGGCLTKCSRIVSCVASTRAMPSARAVDPQAVALEQRARGLGQLAEAVDQLLVHRVERVLRFAVRQALVQRQALVHVAAVARRQQRRHVQVDLGADVDRVVDVGAAPRAQRAHRAFQHLRVERKAHFLDLAGLRFAEHFAGAADLEVVHGEEEARAEFLHRLDGLQPLLRLGAERFEGVGAFAARREQVGVGLVVRAADAAAQLVQLREAEAVGAVDDDGVGGRHVDAGLDDRRAQQQVVALRVELAHHALQLALAHLAVRHGDARLGQQALEPVAHVLDGVDLVVQEVDLPAALAARAARPRASGPRNAARRRS